MGVTLDLSSLQIDKIPTELFALTWLTSLNLENNRIEVIPQDIYKLSNIRNLNLSRNSIEKLPDNLFVLNDLEVLNRFASDKAILQAMPGHFTSTRRDIAGLARELTGHHPAPVSIRDVLEFFQRPAIWSAMQRDLVEPGDHARFIVEVPASASDAELEGLWEQLGQLDLHVLPLVLRSDGSRRDGDVPGTVPVEAANAAAVGQARAWA